MLQSINSILEILLLLTTIGNNSNRCTLHTIVQNGAQTLAIVAFDYGSRIVQIFSATKMPKIGVSGKETSSIATEFQHASTMVLDQWMTTTGEHQIRLEQFSGR